MYIYVILHNMVLVLVHVCPCIRNQCMHGDLFHINTLIAIHFISREVRNKRKRHMQYESYFLSHNYSHAQLNTPLHDCTL